MPLPLYRYRGLSSSRAGLFGGTRVDVSVSPARAASDRKCCANLTRTRGRCDGDVRRRRARYLLLPSTRVSAAGSRTRARATRPPGPGRLRGARGATMPTFRGAPRGALPRVLLLRYTNVTVDRRGRAPPDARGCCEWPSVRRRGRRSSRGGERIARHVCGLPRKKN